jgi:class 3 adenylate cyclase
MAEQIRKTVSILFSDVVGHTTAEDDERSGPNGVAAGVREAQRERVEKHRGEWIREVGGGALSSFDTAAGALSCALEMQRAFASDPEPGLRIGIHTGELLVRKTQRGTDVFGDSIVVAARLQGLAEPGGIWLSGRAYQGLPTDQKGLEFEYLGEKRLQSVNRPVPVYRVVDPASVPVGLLDLEENHAGALRSLWLRPLAWIAAAAGLALIAAYWVARFEPRRSVAESELERPVLSAEQKLEASRLVAFAAVRDDLLALAATGLGARVWTIPDPVKNGAAYQVGFEADCDCTVLLFAVNGMTEEIALLYPNSFEPRAQITRGETFRIPSSPEWRLRAMGREGVDVLKLIAVEGALDFPGDRSEPWVVTPDQIDRVDELRAMLEQIRAGAWGAATAPLKIVPQ